VTIGQHEEPFRKSIHRACAAFTFTFVLNLTSQLFALDLHSLDRMFKLPLALSLVLLVGASFPLRRLFRWRIQTRQFCFAAIATSLRFSVTPELTATTGSARSGRLFGRTIFMDVSRRRHNEDWVRGLIFEPTALGLPQLSTASGSFHLRTLSLIAGQARTKHLR
jgi:hypothetical protein